MFSEPAWLAIGFTGQSLFFMRFLIQWIVSERKKQSVIPVAFWYLSLGGGMIVLTYAIHRRDPVFIAAQSTGILVYIRNIWLILRHRRLTKGLEGK